MISVNTLIVPTIFLLIGLAIRYFEDVRKHRIIPDDPARQQQYSEYRRFLRISWYCVAASTLLIGILIGSYL